MITSSAALASAKDLTSFHLRKASELLRLRRRTETRPPLPLPANRCGIGRPRNSYMIFVLQCILRIAVIFGGVVGTVWLIITIDRWNRGKGETWQEFVVFFSGVDRVNRVLVFPQSVD